MATLERRSDFPFSQAVLDALPSHVILLSAARTILAVNRAWEEFAAESGDTDHRLTDLGGDYLEAVDRAAGPYAAEAQAACLGIRAVLDAVTQQFSLEFPYHSAARQRWFHLQVKLVGPQSPRTVVVLHHDISERKRAEQRLLEGDLLRQTITDNATTAIFVADAKNRCLFMNPSGEALTGYSYEEIKGRNLHELIHHSHPDGTPFPASECPVGKAVMSLQALRDHEDVILRKDGTFVSVLCQIKPLASCGDLSSVVVELVDITHRKQAEESLLLLRSLIDRANDAIEIIDPETGRFLDVNEKACRAHGYTRDEYLALTVAAIDPLVAKRSWEEVRREVRQAGFVSLESQHQRKDGSIFPVEVNVNHVQLNRDYFVAVVRDITERKKLEEQLRQSQKMDAIGQLAGGVAHDFNNLLTIINGYSEMLMRMTAPNDPRDKFIHDIKHAAERAAGLTSQLLAFSRRQIMEPKALILNDLIGNTERMLRRLIGEDILLVTDYAPGLKRVKVDPGQVEQVVMNLAVNARDAMPRGGRLTIQTRCVELNEADCRGYAGSKPGQYVMVSIGDTGCGMTPEVVARIFEPFFTTKELGRGTGLGLAMVYGIVQQSNGYLAVESQVGQGTTFKILFPQVCDIVVPSASKQGIQTASQGAETVLVVEDEAAVRVLVRIALERHGYKLLEARDGRQAMSVAKDHDGPIDLLLTDVVMPEMSGGQLAKILCAINPRLKVLFMSGYADDTVVRHRVEELNHAFLQKPFSTTGLARRVREVLDGAK